MANRYFPSWLISSFVNGTGIEADLGRSSRSVAVSASSAICQACPRTMRTRSLWIMCCVAFFATGRAAPAIDIIKIVSADDQKRPSGQVRFAVNQIDHWVFGGKTSSDGRKNLEEKLAAKSSMLADACHLADLQQEKLNLAGLGDIHGFFREFERLQRDFDPQNPIINDIWQETQVLQKKYNGDLYGDGSLFAQVLKQQLTREQWQLLQERRNASRQFHLEASIRQLVASFDQVSPLQADNRERLTQLLLKHTPLPKAVENAQQQSMLVAYILFHASEIPEQELRECLQGAEWDLFEAGRKTAHRWRAQLQQCGLIEK